MRLTICALGATKGMLFCMIEIKSLTKKFKKKVVLQQISARLDTGVYGLLGPNGAGKTTLLRCLTDIYTDYQGEILFDEKSLRKHPDLRMKIGYLPQKFDLFRELTLHEMMQYFASLKYVEKKMQEPEIERALKLVNLSDQRDTRCGALSGGMTRRVGIAQAVLGNPPVLIVDEPTAGLDPEERIRFKNVLASLREGRTILLSTHIVEDVEALCDHIIIMNEGRFLHSAGAQEICGLARGKIYEVEEAQCKALRHFEVIRTVLQGERTKYRILTEETVASPPLTPTVEDGYLCAIKGLSREK